MFKPSQHSKPIIVQYGLNCVNTCDQPTECICYMFLQVIQATPRARSWGRFPVLHFGAGFLLELHRKAGSTLFSGPDLPLEGFRKLSSLVHFSGLQWLLLWHYDTKYLEYAKLLQETWFHKEKHLIMLSFHN